MTRTTARTMDYKEDGNKDDKQTMMRSTVEKDDIEDDGQQTTRTRRSMIRHRHHRLSRKGGIFDGPGVKGMAKVPEAAKMCT